MSFLRSYFSFFFLLPQPLSYPVPFSVFPSQDTPIPSLLLSPLMPVNRNLISPLQHALLVWTLPWDL